MTRGSKVRSAAPTQALASPFPQERGRPRTRWSKPLLTAHGDLRELTMGITPDIGESGPGGNVYRPA
ncbi:MAG: lasso RiPP family leader peptide-containing protein [Thermoanaerobaculia bacterium]|nr:lasso RiPP family leader peptide-containing protein [Thermoanaerobaculia bacterium]